jgi:microcystin-dependent protein
MSEMAAHTHSIQGDSNPASQASPVGNTWGQQDLNPYSNAANTTMNPTTSGVTGGGQPHTNIQPFLVLNFIIALQGIFPSQN